MSQKEAGIVQAVLEDFRNQRLPHLLKIKEQVDAGSKLHPTDLKIIEESIQEAHSSADYAERHPELKSLVAKVSELYQQITSKALENEKGP